MFFQSLNPNTYLIYFRFHFLDLEFSFNFFEHKFLQQKKNKNVFVFKDHHRIRFLWTTPLLSISFSSLFFFSCFCLHFFSGLFLSHFLALRNSAVVFCFCFSFIFFYQVYVYVLFFLSSLCLHTLQSDLLYISSPVL